MSETFCFVFTFQPLMAVSASPTFTRFAVVFGTSTISFLVRTREQTHAHTHTQKSIQYSCQMSWGQRINSVSAATVSVLLCFTGRWGEGKDILVITTLVQVDRRAFLQHAATLIRGTNIAPVAVWLHFQLHFFFLSEIRMQVLQGAYFLALLLAGVQTGIWFDLWDMLLQNMSD